MTTEAYARREFRRFLWAIGFKNEDSEEVKALIMEMQKTAQARGMSEYEIATTYDADALFEIYCETMKRRQ